MTVEIVEMVIARAMSDADFRDLLKEDARVALADYSINDEELRALLEGDEKRLKELGIRDELAHAAREGIHRVTLL